MTQQRDIERLLDHWFSAGPDHAPDRVVDIVTDRIERQSQQPAWRLQWRPSPVNVYAKFAVAAAAVLIVAIVGYNLLPAGSTIGTGGPAPTASQSPTPAPSASPSPTPAQTASPSPTTRPTGAFGGTVHWRDNAQPVRTDVDGVATGATVTGTAVHTFVGGAYTVRLACATRNGDIWVLGGTTEQGTPGVAVGTWLAIIVKESVPQQIAIRLSADAPAGSDCAGFLASHDFAELGPENFSSVNSGTLVSPPDPAP